MLLHGIQTQGAKTSMGLSEYFTIQYTVSYSINQENWTIYQGNSTKSSYVSTNIWISLNLTDLKGPYCVLFVAFYVFLPKVLL